MTPWNEFWPELLQVFVGSLMLLVVVVLLIAAFTYLFDRHR
jgi:hypothetical protein